MKRKTLTTRRGLSLILAAALAAAWLLGSAAMTLVTADYIRSKLVNRAEQLTNTHLSPYWAASDDYWHDRLYHGDPGYKANEMIRTNLSSMMRSPYIRFGSDSLFGSDLRLNFQSELTYTFPDGTELGKSSYLAVRFWTEERWNSASPGMYSHGWIDLAAHAPELTEQIARWEAEADFNSITEDMLLIRGSLGSNGQIIPTAVSHIPWNEFVKHAQYNANGSYSVSHEAILKAGKVQWTEVFDSGGGEQVFYCTYLHFVPPSTNGPMPTESNTDGLWRMDYAVQHDKLDYCSYETGDTLPPADFTASLSVRAYPILLAMGALKWYYLATAALAALLWHLAQKRLVKHAADPLERMVRAIDRNGAPDRIDFDFAEVHAVNRGLIALQDRRLALENEITRLQKALDYAEEAELQRRRTTNALAHELKTPLAVVHSYAEGLQLGIAGEKTPAYIQTILKESEKMDGLVMEMLDLSRLEAGKITIARDNFDLGAVTRDIFEKMAPLAEKKNLSVELAMEGEFPVVADETRIRQAVENYASNAMKYTPEGGRITASLSRHSGSLRLTVENSCPPLSKEALERVWEPFYRADAARTTPGTGLGLAITATVIQLHRGKVGVENTPDGVRFWFSLPR